MNALIRLFFLKKNDDSLKLKLLVGVRVSNFCEKFAVEVI